MRLNERYWKRTDKADGTEEREVQLRVEELCARNGVDYLEAVEAERFETCSAIYTIETCQD